MPLLLLVQITFFAKGTTSQDLGGLLASHTEAGLKTKVVHK